MRVLVVEDAVRLRASLVQGLSEKGYTVDWAADGAQALQLAESDRYGVIVLDWMIPKVDGLAVLRTLRAKSIQSHVIMLTARDAIEDRVTGLRQGADDYLVKPFAFEELVARLQALARRSPPTRADVLRVGRLVIDRTHRIARVADSMQELRLTPREFAILEHLACRADHPVSRHELHRHVYVDHAQVMSNAIESAVCCLRLKLNAAGCEGVLHTRRKIGYVLRTEPEK